MEKQATFHPAPGFAGGGLAVTVYNRPSAWPALQEELAASLGCDPDRLDTIDCAWAGGERFADFVVLGGQIIGSLNNALTGAEWAEFHRTHIADPEAHLRQAIGRPHAA